MLEAADSGRVNAASSRAPAGVATVREPGTGGLVRWRDTIPFLRPEPPRLEAVARYFELSRQAGMFANGGPCHRLLVERLERYLGGGAACVPVASGTSGLLLAMRAAFGPPRDAEVIVPSFTFTASACAIEWCGFRPRFVDVDADSWQMDPEALTEALRAADGEVAGVLGCATFGVAPPRRVRAAWRAATTSAGVPLVIDSAAGFGTTDSRGRPLGCGDDTEVFSFHATKPFGIGEGGLVTTGDPAIAERIARLGNFGIEGPDRTSGEAGLNGKMSEMSAAAGLAMLDRFDEDLARRRATAARLRDALGAAGASFQAGCETSTTQLMQVRVDTPAARDACRSVAPRLGVDVRTYHDPPLHRHPAFAGAARGPLPVTDDLAARSLSLPMANRMPPEDIARISAVVATGVAAAC